MPTTTSPPSGTTQPTTPLPDADQWITSTTGRIAPDAYSWMQAVHWVAGHASADPDASHGPIRVGTTTLRVAVLLARLKECRPGVDNLARWLNLSARTVKYHLRILRRTGLLTYRSKGTRVSGVGGRASEFARTVPHAFDQALGLRTVPSTVFIRAVCGIDRAHRALMARLGKKARRSLKKNPTKRANRPSRTATSATPSCTPRGVSTCSFSSTGTTSLPPESELGSGRVPSPATSKPTQRKLNAVGRRYQLASQLVRQLPWLHRASVPRIAWVLRHVADHGWSAAEVIAVVGQEAPARRVRRPSGFLAARLNGVHRLYDTPAKRQKIVTWWRDSQHAERDRNAEWEGDWTAPTSRAVAREVDEAFTRRPVRGPALDAVAAGDDGLADLRHLTRDEVIGIRAAAQKDPGLILTTIAECGEPYARRLFTNQLVDQLHRLRGNGRLLPQTRWRHA